MSELDKEGLVAHENEVEQLSDFASLLEENFKPSSEAKKSDIENAMQTLAEHALKNTSIIDPDSLDAISTIQKLVSSIDKKLSEQLDLVLHHEEFQTLESSWQGLHHLVNNTETSTKLKIRFMNISKSEVHKTLKKFKGTNWDQSPLFKKVYEEEYGTANGAPYACLIGDYYFDHTPPDVEFLSEISHIAAAAHAPFITAAGPSMLEMGSWQDINNPRDVSKIFEGPEYAAWRSFRDSADSQYVAMAMPRFLGRLPYGAKTNPVDEFAFEESVDGTDHNDYLWVNAAYAMATNINRSFAQFGWSSQIAGVDSGGVVDNLPVHTFDTDDGGVDSKCPTEVSIPDRREKELSDNGLTSLIHYKNTDYAAFFKATSLRKPVVYEDPEATSNAKLATNLSYIFATSRFAHYLKHIVRNKIGTSVTADKLQSELHAWIKNYVEEDAANASERGLAERPLSAAEVVVEDDEENPGFYKARFYLTPHYKLEGMTIAMSLVSKLPSEREG
jgi:type VI secretion system protein ImpC